MEVPNSKKTKDFISGLVQMSLAFHNLNRAAESRIDVSLVQYHLLQILRDMPGTSLQNLSKSAGMHPSTLTQSIKRLSKKGMIFVDEDPKDSRKKILSLTAKGNASIAQFESQIAEFIASYDMKLPERLRLR